MSWYQYLDIIRESRDLVASGRDIEAAVCPNDGELLSTGPHGELFCKFDGYRPLFGGRVGTPDG